MGLLLKKYNLCKLIHQPRVHEKIRRPQISECQQHINSPGREKMLQIFGEIRPFRKGPTRRERRNPFLCSDNQRTLRCLQRNKTRRTANAVRRIRPCVINQTFSYFYYQVKRYAIGIGFANGRSIVRHEMSSSNISKTVWPRITKFYRYIHTDIAYRRTGYDVIIYVLSEVIWEKQSILLPWRLLGGIYRERLKLGSWNYTCLSNTSGPTNLPEMVSPAP